MKNKKWGHVIWALFSLFCFFIGILLGETKAALRIYPTMQSIEKGNLELKEANLALIEVLFPTGLESR